MNWLTLESISDLEQIIESSFKLDKGIAIFKHSTRCSISSMAKSRLSSKWSFTNDLPIYYLDLIQFRDVSNAIAQKFNIEHQSPQLLLIKDGVCIYNASHLSISVSEIEEL